MHAIGMEFKKDKGSLVHLKRGSCENFVENDNLIAGEIYTYLGVEKHYTQEMNRVRNTPSEASIERTCNKFVFKSVRKTKFLPQTNLPFRLYSTTLGQLNGHPRSCGNSIKILVK